MPQTHSQEDNLALPSSLSIDKLPLARPVQANFEILGLCEIRHALYPVINPFNTLGANLGIPLLQIRLVFGKFRLISCIIRIAWVWQIGRKRINVKLLIL